MGDSLSFLLRDKELEYFCSTPFVFARQIKLKLLLNAVEKTKIDRQGIGPQVAQSRREEESLRSVETSMMVELRYSKASGSKEEVILRLTLEFAILSRETAYTKSENPKTSWQL